MMNGLIEDRWDALIVAVTAACLVTFSCLYLGAPGSFLRWWLYAAAFAGGAALALKNINFKGILGDAWRGASDNTQLKLMLAGVFVAIAVPAVAVTWLLNVYAPELIPAVQGIVVAAVVVYTCLFSLVVWLGERWERERQEAAGVEAE